MFKSLSTLFDKLKNNYYIFQKIIYLRKIKPRYLFFSEDRKYQKYAYLLIETLGKKYPQEVYYVSLDVDDKIKNPDVKNIFIGKGLIMNIFFLIIRAQNFFLTLTDLDNHVVKKTKNVDKYIYYFHGAVSTTKVYTATAFDNYDIILCNGDYHLNEIRKRESIKKIKKKKLIKTGYFYFDYLNNKINTKIKANEILIAPSWNYSQKDYINENLEEIIQSVLNKGYIVKFRPHPESFKRSMLTINSLMKKFSTKKFILDETSENIKVKTKLLVDATGPLRKVMYDSKEEQPEMVLGSGTEYEIEVSQEIYDQFKDKLLFFLGHKWSIKGYSWIFPMENRILKVGAGKTHLTSLNQEKTDKTTRKITEKIIAEYVKATDYKIIDKHGGIIRYSRGLKDKFYHNKVVGVGDGVSAINPRGGEGIRYAMQTADLASTYIDEYLKTGKENFENYRKIWRRKKLLKWNLSEFSGRRMYSRYSDAQVENRVQFFYDNFNIDEMIASLFNFKYSKPFTRLFQYSFIKLSYLFKKEKF